MTIRFLNHNVEGFITALNRPTLAKALRTLDLLEKFGKNLGMPHSKKIEDRLYELRIRGSRELRIFYTFHKNEVIILLHAFVKKTQRLPIKDINLAKARLKELDKK